MISYSRDTQDTIPASAVKIVGLGGAGANMLERIALDSIDGAELLALNTDIRTLGTCLAKEKIQLGVNLTKGLGTGGDPELGQQAMLEAEAEVRAALKGQRIVFLCTGLGGGTGSGAAPIVSRIAREEGAFVVVFATMPFFFEGRRRREQAETSLNQLAVLSNALVTFDNNRMGELVLAKQGIHEAFASADQMISESIKAVIRLVIRPGLINIGLDDLMSALRTNRSRCLFGSGLADGKDRATKALRNALSSPLLDQGSLLREAQTVLVHLSGGESLTLFEIELLMQSLQKHVPEKAHVLFGAAIDPTMGDNLSITLISALPEDALTGGTRDTISPSKSLADLEPSEDFTRGIENPFSNIDHPKQETEPKPKVDSEPEKPQFPKEPAMVSPAPSFSSSDQNESWTEEDEAPSLPAPRPTADQSLGENVPLIATFHSTPPRDEVAEPQAKARAEESYEESRPFAESDFPSIESRIEPENVQEEEKHEAPEVEVGELLASKFAVTAGPKARPADKPMWGKADASKAQLPRNDPFEDDLPEEPAASAPSPPPPVPLQLDSKHPGSQSELAFEKAPRGRFEGENPNVFEGEDLDLPPFLRKKRS